MLIDITQELFSCTVYPGDDKPEKIIYTSMEDRELYNLTGFSMCSHNGTHVDAPSHFIKGGKTIDQMGLEPFVGYCYVARYDGVEEGRYFLNAAPLNLGGCEGAPCRAYLLTE